jgi:hypothetical protein
MDNVEELELEQLMSTSFGNSVQGALAEGNLKGAVAMVQFVRYQAAEGVDPFVRLAERLKLDQIDMSSHEAGISA